MSIITNIKHKVKLLLKYAMGDVTHDRKWYFDTYKLPGYKADVGESDIAIDVFIPVIEKDLETLPYSIAGVRKHVKHPIKNIFIVAPMSDIIKRYAEQNNCIYVYEQDLVATKKQDLNVVINGVNRSNWIFQQLLKFNFSKVTTCSHYLVIDSDTTYINDVIFCGKKYDYLDFSDEYHEPYFRTYEKLTGLKHVLPVSFICHYMLFNVELIGVLKQYISEYNNCSFEEAIIRQKESATDPSYFSEYETYANFVLTKYSNKIKLRYWFNKAISRRDYSENTIENFKNEYKSISMHGYL